MESRVRAVGLAFCLAGAFGAGACSSSSSSGNYAASGSQIAGEAAGGAATSSEGGSTVAMLPNDHGARRPWARLVDRFDLFADASASTCGAFSALAGLCTAGSSDTVTLGGCSNSGVSWTGTVMLGCTGCTAGNGTCSITRTLSDGAVRTGPNVTITFKTTSVTTYSSAALSNQGQAVTTCTAGNCRDSRTIDLGAIELVAVPASGGSALYDHTVSGTGITVSGVGANRTVMGGSITVYHNLLKATGTATITTPLTFTAGCCHPTGGTVSVTWTGGITGTETTTFGSCGTGTEVSTSGTSTAVDLQACLP